jgi:hypothetical protein
MFGRVDVQRFASGAARIENFIINPQGGIFRRPGTRFVAEAKNSSKKTILLPFSFSDTQAYILEFGDYYIRFYKDEGRIDNAAINVTGCADNGAGLIRVTLASAHGIASGTRMTLSGITGTTEANGTWVVDRVSDTAVDLRGSTFANAYVSGGAWSAGAVEIESPYAEADLEKLRITQSADVLYICHPGYSPRKLSRSSHTSWSFSGLNLTDGPYLDMNVDDTLTLTLSATTGSGVTMTAAGPLFTPQHVGSRWRIEESIGSKHDQWKSNTSYSSSNQVESDNFIYKATTSGTSKNRAPVHDTGNESDGGVSWDYYHPGFGIVEITGYTSATVVTVKVISRCPDSATGGTLRWREGAWSGERGYPTSCVFFKERLCFASTTYQPQTLWFSVTGDFENFAPTDRSTEVLDTQAITITLAASQVNKIVWIAAQSKLQVGTIGGEWVIGPSATNKPFAPDNVDAAQQTTYGSENMPALSVGTVTVFIQRGGVRARELIYNFEIDGYISKDLNLISDHILRDGDGVKAMAYQQEPFSAIYMVMNDGTVSVLTYLRDQEVIGWSRMILGGSFGDGHSVVESVASIPGGPNGEDYVWFLVKRTVDGNTVRYIEFMENVHWPETPSDKDGMWYIDCGLSLDSGVNVSSVSGLDHLEDETVQVVVDGAVEPSEDVASGAITLQRAGKKIRVGLPFICKMTTLPLDTQGALGTVQGKIKRVHKVTFRLFESLGFEYGDGLTASTLASFRAAYMPMDSSPDYYTGDWEILLEQSFERWSQWTVAQSQPYPLNILAIMPEGTIYES